MERAGIDLTGPWPKSSNNVYILVFVDHFTKWGDAVPLPNKEAETVAKALVQRIFTRVGCVLELLSDQGKEFDNALLTALCNLLGTHKLRTSPYKPSTNASVERLNRSIGSLIAKCIDDNQKNWTEILPFVMSAYRSAVHESTGYSPNYLFYGRELYAPIDLVTQQPPEKRNTEDYVDFVERVTKYAHEKARECLKAQAERRKQYYDMKVNRTEFQKHDWVWYFYPRKRTGKSMKWQKLYTGPFLVLAKLGPVTYAIQKSLRADPLIVHVDKLKLFEGPAPRSWLTPYTMATAEAEENVTSDEAILPENDLSMVAKKDECLSLPAESLKSTQVEIEGLTESDVYHRPRRQAKQPGWTNDYVLN